MLLGVAQEDSESDADYLAEKIAGLRIFEDDAGKMNLSVADVGGSVLAVSQFTLFGDVRRGKRPSFDAAARPEHAKALYEHFVERIRAGRRALRDGPLPGDDGSRTGELRAGHDSTGFEEGILSVASRLMQIFDLTGNENDMSRGVQLELSLRTPPGLGARNLLFVGSQKKQIPRSARDDKRYKMSPCSASPSRYPGRCSL